MILGLPLKITHYEDDHQIDEHIEAEITLGLEQTETGNIPVLYLTYLYYRPVSMNITSFNYNSTEKVYNSSDHNALQARADIKQIPPDILVKSGDGKNNFYGRAGIVP